MALARGVCHVVVDGEGRAHLGLRYDASESIVDHVHFGLGELASVVPFLLVGAVANVEVVEDGLGEELLLVLLFDKELRSSYLIVCLVGRFGVDQLNQRHYPELLCLILRLLEDNVLDADQGRLNSVRTLIGLMPVHQPGCPWYPLDLELKYLKSVLRVIEDACLIILVEIVLLFVFEIHPHAEKCL